MKRVVYIAAFLIVGFLVGFSIWKDKVYKDTIAKNQMLTVRILNIACASGKGQSSLYFRDIQNKINHANINHQDCSKYKKGDMVILLYDEAQDWNFVQSN